VWGPHGAGTNGEANGVQPAQRHQMGSGWRHPGARRLPPPAEGGQGTAFETEAKRVCAGRALVQSRGRGAQLGGRRSAGWDRVEP
jgi:hypothetical protein